MCGRNCSCITQAPFQDLCSYLWVWMQVCLEKCDDELACKEVKLGEAGIAADFLKRFLWYCVLSDLTCCWVFSSKQPWCCNKHELCVTHVKVYWISEVWGSFLGHLTLFEEGEKYLCFPFLQIRCWVFLMQTLENYFSFLFLTLKDAE